MHLGHVTLVCVVLQVTSSRNAKLAFLIVLTCASPEQTMAFVGFPYGPFTLQIDPHGINPVRSSSIQGVRLHYTSKMQWCSCNYVNTPHYRYGFDVTFHLTI